MKVHLGKTKNGMDVYVDEESSHASTHFVDTPKLLDSVKRIIPTIDLVENHVRFEKDTGEEVGNSALVETYPGDDILYALRPRRTEYSRFVKNKLATSTNWITLDLRKSEENQYDLYTAFAGRLTPSFPGGDYLTEQSVEFLSKHALVWGSQEIVSGTETSECPW